MADDPRGGFVDRIEAIRERWHRLVADVGEERMELPGAMGNWSFKDVASHLTAWRRRTIDRLEAAGRGDPSPPAPWPAELVGGEDDPINAWIHERTKNRPLSDVLAEADATYDAFIAAVVALPPEDATDPERFDWLEDEALVDPTSAAIWPSTSQTSGDGWPAPRKAAGSSAVNDGRRGCLVRSRLRPWFANN